MIGNPRETRCSDIPDEWKERLSSRACPVCGKERKDFDGRHRGYQKPPQYNDPTWYGGTPCCCSDCTSKYWGARKTWQHHRDEIFHERKGICAGCGKSLISYPFPNKNMPLIEDWTLDHILPIALGGSMWDPNNHQILCSKCNKEKTARDLGQIAAAKRLHSLKLPDMNTLMSQKQKLTTQQKLF